MDIRQRVYVASKVSRMEGVVQELISWLEERGYSVPYDWTQYPVLKPYELHAIEAAQAAEKMARAVMECDILIVLCAKNGVGYHIETGGALVASIVLGFITGQQQKKIYVVGEGNKRSIFYYHPTVERVATIFALQSLLQKL